MAKKKKIKSALDYEFDDLVVESAGGRRMTLNPQFIHRNNADANIEELKRTFSLKLHLEDILEKVQDPASMRVLDRTLQDLEFRIQELFNFKPDVHFHRFWERPQCKCPKMDNQDSYGTGVYSKNSSCPLHGSIADIDREEERLAKIYRGDP